MSEPTPEQVPVPSVLPEMPLPARRFPAAAMAWFTVAGLLTVASLVATAWSMRTPCGEKDLACQVTAVTFLTGVFLGYAAALSCWVLGAGVVVKDRQRRYDEEWSRLSRLSDTQ